MLVNMTEVPVWCRTEKREKLMRVDMAAGAVARGAVDLVGPGSLPFRRDARAGDATAGDGEGFAFVVLKFAPHRVSRMRLDIAQRNIVSGMAVYVDALGVPLDKEPAIVAAEPIADVSPGKSLSTRLRSLARL